MGGIAEVLNAAGNAGGIGVAVLLLVVLFGLGRKTIDLVETKVLPLASNHLKHVEKAFDDVAAGYNRLSDAVDDLRREVQEWRARRDT